MAFVTALGCLCVLLPEPGFAAAPDSARFRLEVGARADVTNEVYYQDAFLDTTFLGRQRMSTPEGRMASVLAGVLTGTRQARAAQYELRGEMTYGDQLQRGFLGGRWKSPAGTNWTLVLLPSAEYRRDRTFDRDLTEWRGALAALARCPLGDGLTAVEIGGRGDLLKASGPGSEFLLDRHSGGVSAAIDHFGLAGNEARAGYRLTTRSFPDSTVRDHLEHYAEGRLRWGLPGSGTAAVEIASTRRVTLREAPTSRDNFWNGETALEWRSGPPGSIGAVARLEGEVFRYDLQDSTIFFDYDVARALLLLRWERGVRWTMSLGPRAEVLAAPLNPGEGYQEVAAMLEAEFLGSGAWWSVGPAAGWRDYDESQAAGPGTSSLHSSCAFYELNLIADQPLAGRLRLRAIAAVRVENHIDPAQNAVSLYATGELRWH